MKDVWVRKPSFEEKKLLESCPTWSHESETWPAEYDEREETCLVIEGSAYVTLEDQTIIRFTKGDLVTFRPCLKCTWTVETAIQKYYIFDM